MKAGWIGASAALLGFLAVLLAAVGAHAMSGMDEAQQNAWRNAQDIHFLHTACLLALAAWCRGGASRLVWAGTGLLLLGTLMFSGSIYLKQLGYPILPGPVTPAGGMALMLGWLLLLIAFALSLRGRAAA